MKLQCLGLQQVLASIASVTHWGVIGSLALWGAPEAIAPAPGLAAQAAKSADRFVDSIGTTIHLHYLDTAYRHFDRIVKPRLSELGIRHVRDHAITYPGANRDTFYYQRCRALAATGVRFNLVTMLHQKPDLVTNYAKLGDVYRWCNGAVEAFEGVNEPDLQGIKNWVSLAQAAQQQLFRTVRRNPTLASIAIIGPSPTSAPAAKALGRLSPYLDYVNIHNYYGGRHPESTGWAGSYGSVRWYRTYIASPIGNKPLISTETGWHNAVNTKSDHLGTPEMTVGKYVPRLFLHHFNQEIVRTYIYELLDEWPRPNDHEANFGLVRYDGSPKPAFTALKNLIRLLADPKAGPRFVPGTLAYRLDGNTQNVQQSLFQKQNGDFYLALWIGAPSWDPVAKTEIAVPNQAVTLTIPRTIKRAIAHALDETGALATMNLQPVTVGGSNQLQLTLTDRVTLVQLSTTRG